MINLSEHFDSNGFVLYDDQFLADETKRTLKKQLYDLGKTMFPRTSGNRVRGGLSSDGKQCLVSEKGLVPIPGISWDGTPISEIATLLTEKLHRKGILPSEMCFNYCLYNMYETNKDYIAFHSDSEYNSIPIIASVTLGNPRKFCFLEKKTNDTADMYLEDGSLLVFGGDINTDYMHSIPPCSQFNTEEQFRINLTFRVVYPVPSVQNPDETKERHVKLHIGVIDGFKRRYFTDDFWFITPREAIMRKDSVIMIKRWGTAGKLSIDHDVITNKASTIKGKKDEVLLDSSDWFILPGKMTRDDLLQRLTNVSKFLLWKYPQIPNKRPVPIRPYQFYDIFYDTPIPGRPRKHTVIIKK